MTGTLRIRGEVWLTLETVADCYRVEITWVREVYELGLIGLGEPAADSIAVPAATLDRLAMILRLQRLEGVGLRGIAMLLEEAGAR